ncbi:MAG: zinc ribbon domain-containing protein [Eubacterium sp.]|nr:zinc ribbon domain-containing protein [Eubacterium sp.]
MRVKWFEKDFMEREGWPILYRTSFSEEDISADRKKIVDIIYNKMMQLRKEWTGVSVLMPENSTRKHANVFYEAFNRFFGTYSSSEAILVVPSSKVGKMVDEVALLDESINFIEKPEVQYEGEYERIMRTLLGKPRPEGVISEDRVYKCKFCGNPFIAGEEFCSKCGKKRDGIPMEYNSQLREAILEDLRENGLPDPDYDPPKKTEEEKQELIRQLQAAIKRHEEGKPVLQQEEKPVSNKHRVISNLDILLGKDEETFADKLFFYIDQSGKKDTEVYKAAHISKAVFSSIRSKWDKYKPSKETALALAIALQLSLPQTEDLLARAGLRLSDTSKFDIIVSFCIEHEIFNLFDVNEYLDHYEQPVFSMAS